MTITLTTEQLMSAARHVADQLVDSVRAYVVPADVETWTELHEWVDANEYAMNAFKDLGLYVPSTVDDNFGDGPDYENMEAVEDVAFAVFRLTADLDEYRAVVKKGFRFIHDFKTFVKTDEKVFRYSYTDRALRINAVSTDGDYEMTIKLEDVKH